MNCSDLSLSDGYLIESVCPHGQCIRAGGGQTLDETAKALAQLREAADRYERPAELGALEISITPRGMVNSDMARRYAELGVHRLVFVPSSMEGSAIDETITQVAETIIPHL